MMRAPLHLHDREPSYPSPTPSDCLCLTSTRVLPLLAPYANRSLRAGLHRRIASDLEAAFLLLARERLAGRRTRPLKTITTAERELRHAGVPDGACDCRRLAGDCARLATRAENGRASCRERVCQYG